MRPLFSNDYYPTFNRPNVELVTEPIERITPTGIVTADGTARDFDVIVYANRLRRRQVRRHASRSRVAVVRRSPTCWADGAQAYLGITTAGFPNLFMLYLGPTTQGSLIPMIEYEAQYAVKTIRAMDTPCATGST